MTNLAQRFSFDKAAIRGAYVNLTSAVNTALNVNDYCEPVQKLLAEFMAANAVIAELTQFEGILNLQARSDRGVKLILSEHNQAGDMRAIARDYMADNSMNFDTMIGGGLLTVNLTPRVGQRYQGIIKLDDGSLEDSLSHYFKQSEQLDTHLVIRHTNNGVAALMLQAMPNTSHSKLDTDQWQMAIALADTLSGREAEQLEADKLLYRLFHEFDVRSQAPRPVNYQCSCSRSRVAEALKSVAEQELRELIAEDGQIEANCDFCNTAYVFYGDDIDAFYAPASGTQPTLH